jgi:hypothetical protein
MRNKARNAARRSEPEAGAVDTGWGTHRSMSRRRPRLVASHVATPSGDLAAISWRAARDRGRSTPRRTLVAADAVRGLGPALRRAPLAQRAPPLAPSLAAARNHPAPQSRGFFRERGSTTTDIKATWTAAGPSEPGPYWIRNPRHPAPIRASQASRPTDRIGRCRSSPTTAPRGAGTRWHARAGSTGRWYRRRRSRAR